MLWNGTNITDTPSLIYHDELLRSADPITNPNGPGTLVCISEMPLTVNWFGIDGVTVTTFSSGDFIQRRELGPPSLSRLSLNPFNSFLPGLGPDTNGIWSCSAGGMPTLYVGLYTRAPGKVSCPGL